MIERIPCPLCSTDTVDGLLCRHCTSRLRSDLEELPSLMDELRVTLTRQSQTGTGNGGRGGSNPLPFDWNASHVRADVGNTLSTWIRELDMGDLSETQSGCWCEPYRACSGQRTIPLPNTVRAWCGWLLARIERIRSHAASNEIADEIGYQVADVRRAIDTAAEMIYCGACAICSRDLFATLGSSEVVCRYCSWAGIEAVYPVESRRARLLKEAAERLMSRSDIMRAIPKLYGVEIVAATFRSWIHRGQLSVVEITDAGVPLYRVGDVLELARQVAASV